jgi:polypeptide N-acetylgalactosaminyltransferase
VIVIFNNEPLSILLRCIYSIFNRTPKSLLHEIILVNDNSTLPELYEPLEKFVAEHFGEKVKIFNNRERLGLIVTRMEGAQRATGDVIVFLDSHMEVTTNWLPPLLDPIKSNRKTATVPVIDGIYADDLRYERLFGKTQGGFDWGLTFKYFVLSKEDQPPDGDNFVLAVMTGGAYAIDRKYFFELGGYDRGMFLYRSSCTCAVEAC